MSFLLLLGHQSTEEELDKRYPPLGLCMFQAGLIYAAPPAVGAAGLAFNIELYWGLSYTIMGKKLQDRKITLLLCLAPIVHVIVFWGSIFHGLADLSSVQRDPSGIYCHIESKIPTLVTGGSVIGFVLLSVAIEAYTARFLWKRRSAFNELGRRESKNMFPLSLLVRVGIYTLIGAVAVIITIRLNVMPPNTGEYVASMHTLAIIPFSVALLFGSQRDILRVYFCARAKMPFDDNVPNKENGLNGPTSSHFDSEAHSRASSFQLTV
ncbi:hypothetical protein BT96DRAFT_1016522 [Gymnopus androsaceus JB14]|uniref:G-protein coupled receptors family 2 profile 2 domain-containing protein n=1 Tax=Gymnopus androsaceus JB14 TaxID=1447944 RepID=A0A6A4HXN0_9AGAR|nr:hypothetical protein BT96DRAFT_1016522 [Gymnopus androsaceus JB14]